MSNALKASLVLSLLCRNVLLLDTEISSHEYYRVSYMTYADLNLKWVFF